MQLKINIIYFINVFFYMLIIYYNVIDSYKHNLNRNIVLFDILRIRCAVSYYYSKLCSSVSVIKASIHK